MHRHYVAAGDAVYDYYTYYVHSFERNTQQGGKTKGKEKQFLAFNLCSLQKSAPQSANMPRERADKEWRKRKIKYKIHYLHIVLTCYCVADWLTIFAFIYTKITFRLHAAAAIQSLS